MAARFDPWELLFSSAGRIGRRAYALSAFILFTVAAAWRVLAPEQWPWWAGLPVYGPVLFCAGCVTSKRLHDRGRTGWWGLLALPAVLLLWARAESATATSPETVVLIGICLVITAVLAAETIVFSGQPEFNRYGPARKPTLR